MKRTIGFSSLIVVVLTSISYAQLDQIVIAAGTPEDQALQEITKEADAQKKLGLYENFLQKFSSNSAAVAYGNWQISQDGAAPLQTPSRVLPCLDAENCRK